MIIPVGYGQFNLFFTGADLPRGAQMTCGFKNDAALSALDAAGVIAGITVSDLMPQLADSVTLEQVKVKLGPNDTGDEGLVPATAPGEVAAQGYSPQVAALVVKLTSLGGHEGRGRFFVPGLYETASDGAGRFVTGALDDWQTTFDQFWQDLNDADLPAYLLHNSATVPTLIQSFQVAALFATQRRRIRRVGGRRTTP